MTQNCMLLNTPIRIGNKTMKNRIVMAPMESRMNDMFGDSRDEMAEYYKARAKGGAGMIIVENTYVDNIAARSSIASSGLYSDHLIPQKAKVAEAIKDYGCLAIIQLSHGGRQQNAATGLTPVAPSAIPSKTLNRMPKELTVEEIHDIEDAFANAALRAKKAGFDGVEIHGAHGYLINQFLSFDSNKRNDEYGGSRENRLRFMKNIIEKVRKLTGNKFIVGIRLSVDELLGDRGLQAEDTCWYAKELEPMIDYVHCSAGTYETRPFGINCSVYQPAGKLLPLAQEMKKYVQIPVIAVNGLDYRLGEKALQEGMADCIAFGRQLVCEPEFGNKIKENRLDDIRPCCRCNEGCQSGFMTTSYMHCEFNPLVGREKKYVIQKTPHPKRIVVIGGGVAGMEAARVADLLGNEVILLEKSSQLGGRALEAKIPPFKYKTGEMVEWLIRQLKKGNTHIEINADTSLEAIQKWNPDHLILAVGSHYIVPPIKGVQHAITADVALKTPEEVGESAIVIGAGLVGTETAMTLSETKNVITTIVDMQSSVSPEMEPSTRLALIHRLEEDGVQMFFNQKVKEIQPHS
ncbi:MAG: FAD-dependent oxidoreductase, partial [Traorella sp.]